MLKTLTLHRRRLFIETLGPSVAIQAKASSGTQNPQYSGNISQGLKLATLELWRSSTAVL